MNSNKNKNKNKNKNENEKLKKYDDMTSVVRVPGGISSAFS